MLVAYGTAARPNFKRVILPIGGSNGDVITIGGTAAAAADDGAAGRRLSRRSDGTATVLGADNAADAAIARPKAAAMRGAHHAADIDADRDVAMLDAPGALPSNDGELTLGERLRALELAAGNAAASTRLPVSAANEGANRDGGGAAGDAVPGWQRVVGALDQGAPPRADSLAILLTQALASNDGALLERVLSVSQPGVVANTCDRLSPQLALSFLAACVARLQAKPVRGAHLAKWIRALLVAHAAHFANSPQAAGLLSALYSILDTRLALYRPLLALSGRLDLVLAAHARGKRAGAQGHGGGGEDGLPVVYDEPDGPEPEAEDARGGALDSEDGVSDEDGDEEAAEEEEVEEHWETDDEP